MRILSRTERTKCFRGENSRNSRDCRIFYFLPDKRPGRRGIQSRCRANIRRPRAGIVRDKIACSRNGRKLGGRGDGSARNAAIRRGMLHLITEGCATVLVARNYFNYARKGSAGLQTDVAAPFAAHLCCFQTNSKGTLQVALEDSSLPRE